MMGGDMTVDYAATGRAGRTRAETSDHALRGVIE